MNVIGSAFERHVSDTCFAKVGDPVVRVFANAADRYQNRGSVGHVRMGMMPTYEASSKLCFMPSVKSSKDLYVAMFQAKVVLPHCDCKRWSACGQTVSSLVGRTYPPEG